MGKTQIELNFRLSKRIA